MNLYSATLEIQGRKIALSQYQYELARSSPSNGETPTCPSGNKVIVTIEPTLETILFIDSLNNQQKPIDGVIILANADMSVTIKEVVFTHAYIANYKETWNVNKDAPMNITLTLSADNVKIHSGTQGNN